MCGLFGMAGALAYRDKDIMHTLAILSTLRGEDSAGCVVVPRKGGNPITMKTVGTSFDMFNLAAWDKLSLYDKSMFIGHTRKATVGGVTKLAAHPFSYEGAHSSIHGVHNGTLTRWTDLPVEKEVSDSSTAFKNISEHGLRDTVERLGGAYAFIFYDQTTNTLNMLRNNQRTLYYAMSESFDRIIWASEAWMLFAACGRHDFKMANLAPKGDTPTHVLALETDTWFKVQIAEVGTKDVITFLDEETLLGDVIKPEVKTYVHPFHRTGPYGNRTPFEWEGDDEKKAKDNLALPSPKDTTPKAEGLVVTRPSTPPISQRTTPASKDSPSPRPTLTLVAGNSESGSKQSTASEPKKDMVIAGDDKLDDELPASLRVVLDANGLPMSKEAFERITDSSCCFCGSCVDYDDILEHNGGAVHIPGIGLWADAGRFVCTTCVPAATR